MRRRRSRPDGARRPTLATLALALALAVVSAPRAARAGDPDLQWWTLETNHFRIHYARGLEPVADRVAELSEVIYDRVGDSLGYAPRSRTELVITDDTDDANGSATSLPFNTIRLFVSAPGDLSPLGDYDDWYLELLTHEFTHVAHIDNTSGLPALLNAILGKTFSPNQVQPRWIIEGLAVVHESRHSSAGRMRSSLFDMFLRADVLEDNIAGLDQISSSPSRWPQGNLWYLYGSRFLGWISDLYGPNTMRAVSADYGASLVPWGINRAIRRVTGKTYVELYEGWKDHIRRLYAEQVAAAERRGLREGTRITRHGRNVHYPRFAPRAARGGAADEIVYFRDDFNTRSGLYRIPLAAPPDGGARPEVLVARTSGSSSAAFTPAGDLVFTSTIPWNNLYYRDDLVLLPRGETAPGGGEAARRQITQGLRASQPDVSPDGRSIAFTVNTKGTRYLEIASLGPGGAVTGRRDLVPSARFEQAFTPAFSPDGKLLAYSAWTAGGYRDIRLVDVATGQFRYITRDRAVDMSPAWSPDGRTLYFSSDRTGIFNIHAYDLAAGTLRQVTNVRIGAIQPAVSPDGRTLVYVGYTSQGYDLFLMPLDPARFLPALPPPTDRPDPPTEPDGVRARRYLYSPLSTLAPRTFELDYRPGRYGSNALIITASGTDVVGHHALIGQVVVEPDAPEPELSLEYGYRRLPANLGLRLFQVVTPRSGYRINDQILSYDERVIGLTAGIGYPIRGEFLSHSFGFSLSAAGFQGDLPVGDRLDPYALRTIRPPEGVISVAHLGYSFSNTESSYDAGGGVRGVSFSAGLDYAGPATGSTFTSYAFSTGLSTYLPMPWPGHHSLALRVGGAISGGSYPRGSTYVVGGYDLENTSLLDTLNVGLFNSTFTLRGYEPRVFAGKAYYSQTLEYRFPILQPDVGISTLPLYLRRVDASLFLDYGGAFNHFLFDDLRLFDRGSLLYSPQFATSVGGEIWFNLAVGYVRASQLRLGYAYGFSQGAIPGGQLYFVATNSF